MAPRKSTGLKSNQRQVMRQQGGGRFISGRNGFDPGFVDRIQGGGPIGVQMGGPTMPSYDATGNGGGGGGASISVPGGRLPGLPGGGGGNGGGGGSGGGSLPNMVSAGDNPMFQDVFDRATGGTINSFNTAANRLRERLDSAGMANANNARNNALGRGIGNSGIQDAAQFRVQQNTQNAYGQGLVDLENNFENQRQQGLQTALGAGNSIQTNRNFQDKTLFDLLNSREGRSSQERISNNSNANDRYMQGVGNNFQGSQNDANRSLEERLKELEEQNANYRQAYGGSLGNLYDNSNGY